MHWSRRDRRYDSPVRKKPGEGLVGGQRATGPAAHRFVVLDGLNASGEGAVCFAYRCNRIGLQIELAKYRLRSTLDSLSFPFVCSAF
jgi:hypothetical protein